MQNISKDESIEALIICDTYCLSKRSLLTVLQEIASLNSQFKFRWATTEEEQMLLQRFGSFFRPMVVIGEHVFFGVPKKENVLKLLSSSSVQRESDTWLE